MSSPISSDSLLGDPFYTSDFDGGFTPWENIEPLFDQLPNPGWEADNDSNSNLNHYLTHSDSGSDKQNQNSPNSSSVSGTGSVSDELDQDPTASIINERKMKRRISNRESAKRSRLKKQKQVENLSDQVNKLLKEKQERMDVLQLLIHHLGLLMNENARFRSQVNVLRWKLMEFNQILRVQQPEQMVDAHHVDINTVTNNDAIIFPFS